MLHQDEVETPRSIYERHGKIGMSMVPHVLDPTGASANVNITGDERRKPLARDAAQKLKQSRCIYRLAVWVSVMKSAGNALVTAFDHAKSLSDAFASFAFRRFSQACLLR